jgi:hypothetical protein
MFYNIYRTKVYLALIFGVFIISFNGGFGSGDDHSPANNTKSNDEDNLIAQKIINGDGIIINNQTETSFITQFSSLKYSDFYSGVPPMPFSLVDTFTINANAGPPNNGGSAGWAEFFDLIAGPNRSINLTQMSTGSTAAANVSFSVEVYKRSGTGLGGPVGSGPGSSPAGWDTLGMVPVTQGSTASGISLVFTLPTINVPAGDTVGVALKFVVVGPRYFGTGSPPLSYYSDTNLTLVTGEARSAPFTPTGSWFSSRALTGVVRYVIGPPVGNNNNGTGIPEGYNLAQNYPNPFNPSTTIEFSIPVKSSVALNIYNTSGQLVSTLAGGEYQPGTYKIDWNATNFASGVYFYSLQAGNFTQTKKLIFIK